jgi:hypothetical protein
MLSASLSATELAAPPPRWAVGASLALIAAITAILVHVLPPAPGGDVAVTPTFVAVEQR